MPGSSPSDDTVEAVVLDGRKRLLWQSAVRDALLGVAIGVAGVAALLAIGTEYFPPALLWLFAIAGVVAAIVRWKRSQPQPYRVAQLLDRRWRTEDQVSTAYYFLRTPQNGAVAEQQRAKARDLASAGDLVSALPFRVPRAAWAVLVLLALSALLFVARYSLQPALSFQQPLSSMLIDSLLGAEDRIDETDPLMPESPRTAPGEEESAPSLSEEGETRELEERANPPQAESASSTAEQDADPLEIEMPEVEGLSLDNEYGDEMDYNSLVEAERQDAQGDRQGENPSESGTPSKEDSAPGEETRADNWNQQSDTLLDRLKDAFQNMMESLNMEPPPGQQGQQAESGSNQDGESQGKQADASEGQSQGGASESGEAQMEGGEPGEASSEQVAQGDGGADSDQAGEGQPASSAGGNDGSKQAEEMARIEEAMGQLEELYSQRAEEIQGEVMVETETAKQSARTPYQTQTAGHEDLGGTVSRDAIPLAYEAYIKSYFENLRTKN